MQGRKRRADRFAKNSSQWGFPWIDGGDLEAFVAERRRNFAADESHADHDRLAARTHLGAQSIRIADIAKTVDTFEVDAGDARMPVVRAGGNQQRSYGTRLPSAIWTMRRLESMPVTRDPSIRLML